MVCFGKKKIRAIQISNKNAATNVEYFLMSLKATSKFNSTGITSNLNASTLSFRWGQLIKTSVLRSLQAQTLPS